MRHRFSGLTGIGNPDKCLLTNNLSKGVKLNKKFADDLISTFKLLNEFNGFDYNIDETGIAFGIEPAYEHDRLEIIYFNFYDKNSCFWRKGIAMGAYGSRVISKYNFYGDYKRKSKFVKFIDKWYDTIRGELCKDT